MRCAALVLIAALALPAMAQQPASQPKALPQATPAPTGQPAPTTPPPPAPTGQPAGTGQPAPTGQPSATGLQVTPVQPKAIPVPEGPVVKTEQREGGLILEDIKIGDGYEVKPGGAVVVYYQGTLKEGGKVFDSAFQRGEAFPTMLANVIEGWQKGVPGMKVGGVRRLTIPAAMAYGAAGAGQDIPPNADLIFVIQLLDAVQVDDIKVGDGPEAATPFLAVTTHVIKDKDGNEVEKCDAAHPYIWLPGEVSKPTMNFDAMQAGMTGMKVGGKRHIVIPKEMNGWPAQLELKRPQDVPLSVDVELVALRNLPGRKR